MGSQPIGGQGDMASAVADDGDAAPARLICQQQHLDQVDHLLRRVDPIHAAGAAGGVDRDRIAHQRGGMRISRPHARRARADRQQDDRLAGAGGRLGDRCQRPPIAKVLEVKGDDPRRFVGDQRLEAFRGGQVRLVTQ